MLLFPSLSPSFFAGPHGNASSRFQPLSLFDSGASANGRAVPDTYCSVPLAGGFEQAIQAYAIHILSLTYQKIPRAVLAEAIINIEGLSLDEFLEQQASNSGWIIEKSHGKGQLRILPQNEFNHPELKKSAADIVPLEHIT